MVDTAIQRGLGIGDSAETDLGIRILSSESEGEVGDIIRSSPEMMDGANWHPLDDRETNFNVVNNQSSVASKALTELLTNSSDAVIMKAASLAGIDPEAPDAPQSPQEAVKRLFQEELPGAKRAGRLNDIDSDTDLRTFARKNFIMGITGEQATCFTVIDNGEGQEPENFKSTFLSLSHKNKSSIPYAQGKYNMGSSGVLIYCGRKRYKLIVSRRHNKTGVWGWTLIREKPDNAGHPIYEYYAPGAVIPTLKDSEAILPLRRKNGIPDEEVSLETGTIVKVYDYKIDGKSDFIGIRSGIAQNMVSTTIPLRLMDYRYPRENRGGRGSFVDERTALGLEAELTRKRTPNNADNDEARPGEKITISTIVDSVIGTVAVEAVLLDERPECLKATRDRVFHHVNGQVQYKQKRGYLSQSIKLPGLMDNVAIIVDASNLSENAHHKIWSANRENIMNTTEADRYKEIVETALRESPALKEWEQKKAAEKVKKAASKAQNDTFQRLLERVPEIKDLLLLGDVLTTRSDRPKPKPPYEGLSTPTYLELNQRSRAQEPIELEVGERREISFRTDAANDYLTRADSPGRAYVAQLQSKNLPVRLSHYLRDGTLLARIQTTDDGAHPGDTIELEARFVDSNLVKGQLSDMVNITLVEQREKKERTPIDRKPQEPTIALPDSRWTTQDGRSVGDEPSEQWPDGFTASDGGEVKELTAEQSLYLVNYDNATLQKALRQQKPAVRKQTEVMHRTGMVLSMLAMKRQFEAQCEAADEETRDLLMELEPEIHRLNAQAVALIMPILVKTLPDHFRIRTEEDE